MLYDSLDGLVHSSIVGAGETLSDLRISKECSNTVTMSDDQSSDLGHGDLQIQQRNTCSTWQAERGVLPEDLQIIMLKSEP